MTNLPQITTVPAVMDALLAAFAGIASDSAYGVLEVSDGPQFQSSAHDMIALGVGSPSITHHLVRQNRGNAYDEAYDIRFLHWAWSGSRTMSAHRNRCLTVLTAIRAITDALSVPLVVAHRLGDDLEWTHSVSGDGGSCSVTGTLHFAASL